MFCGTLGFFTQFKELISKCFTFIKLLLVNCLAYSPPCLIFIFILTIFMSKSNILEILYLPWLTWLASASAIFSLVLTLELSSFFLWFSLACFVFSSEFTHFSVSFCLDYALKYSAFTSVTCYLGSVLSLIYLLFICSSTSIGLIFECPTQWHHLWSSFK